MDHIKIERINELAREKNGRFDAGGSHGTGGASKRIYRSDEG